MNRAARIDEQTMVEAWRACRADDLHSDVAALAEAAEDNLPAGSHGVLVDLLAALTATRYESISH
jgi:hypothetical protein